MKRKDLPGAREPHQRAPKFGVWIMDWALVPAETTDVYFMKGWGVVKDSQHATIALGLARWIRGFSGQGFGPLISSGSATAPGIGHLVRVLLKSQVAGSWVRMDVSEHSINSAAAAACSSELGGASLDAMHLVKR